jgi:hypothetical protein
VLELVGVKTVIIELKWNAQGKGMILKGFWLILILSGLTVVDAKL